MSDDLMTLVRSDPQRALAVVQAMRAVASAERIQQFARPEQLPEFAAHLDAARAALARAYL